MKKQLCLLGILCLIGVESQLNTPVFAQAVGENRNPQIAIEDFVRSLHPHGVSMASALQYKSEMSATRRNNVRKLLELLKKDNEKTHWSKIVVTLAIIGDSSTVPEIRSFIEKLENQTRIDHFEFRALSSAVWALGILINLREPTESANDEFKKASQFLIQKSQGKKETKSAQQHGLPSPANQSENDINDGGISQRSAILGLAFADTEETSAALDEIYKNESDPRFRKFLEQVIQSGQKIQKVGLCRYREPQNSRCPINRANGLYLAK